LDLIDQNRKRLVIDSPLWCNLVNRVYLAPEMKAGNKEGKSMKTHSASAVRASISFPPDLYKMLEDIAREKKVSLAWVVREATEKYIEDRWPLFPKRD
jgi:predicted DNA-binding ribbon-helix-helix protein